MDKNNSVLSMYIKECLRVCLCERGINNDKSLRNFIYNLYRFSFFYVVIIFRCLLLKDYF